MAVYIGLVHKGKGAVPIVSQPSPYPVWAGLLLPFTCVGSLLVLESWLDFTGELEPPDPLTRLPQLKRHLKQLLMDMGKVQQIATLCSV